MQPIVRLAAVTLTAAPLAAFAASPASERLLVQAEDVYPYATSKKARYASLARQAEELCTVYQGQAHEICVAEARKKFSQ